MKNDESTTESIVFWVPAIAPGSTSKTVVDQQELLASLRVKYELPTHHLSGFGSASLNAALILGHYASTKERVPADCLYVRTETLDSDGGRLYLGRFDVSGLGCDCWCCDDSRDADLGCLALGVENP